VYYQQALTIRREIGDRAGEGNSLVSIGGIYESLGKYEEALDYTQQALTILREIGDRAGEGVSLNNIGMIYDHLGRYKDALDYTQQTLTICREIGDRTGEGTSLSNIGGIYDSLGEYEEALDYYEQAMAVLESVRATAGSEAGRASFIAQWSDLYNRVVNLYHAQGQDAAAFHTSERGRARAFLDAMATGHVQLSDNAAADLLAREQAAHAARRAAQEALAKARAQQPPDDDLIADLEAQRAEAEKEHEAALDAIEARGDQLAALVPGRSTVLDLEQVQALLDEQTTLLSYWVTEDQTLTFVITQESLNAVTLPIRRTDLSTQVNDFRSFANTSVDRPASAVALYEALIAPLKEYLPSASTEPGMLPHLAIIPHNVLHYLPFAALTDGERYLVEDYTLSYLPNASILQFIQPTSPPPGGTEGGTPLILGNPATGDYDAAAIVTERDELGNLRFAEQEAQAIAALYETDALIREAATESVVRERAGASHILHLAAHGVYNPVAPLYSLIVLAPDDDAQDAPASDGWLTVGEVYGLDLAHADLVVLSACQSHLGDLSAGDELVGLTRAFFYAGTPTVVASLWSVDDEATGLLMERFYTHLREGTGKAEALRQAQIEVRDEYPNPYYWSAFVLSGDEGMPGAGLTETPSPSGEDDARSGLCPGAALPLALVVVVGALVTFRK
jgi:CHAT domain-containing protein